MKVSLIIPALNEEDYIPLLLKSIRNQTFTDYELIVANHPKSTDRTGEIAKKFDAKLVEGGEVSFARNKGAQYANGEILYFIDADAEFPDKDYLKRCIESFEKRNLEISSTLMCPNKKVKESFSAQASIIIWSVLKQISNKLPKPFIESGGSMIFKKETFEQLNGFREELPNGIPEDLDIALRAVKKNYKYEVISEKLIISGRRYDKPLRAIKRCIAIATLGNLAMKTNLHQNERYVRFYQKLYGDLGGKS